MRGINKVILLGRATRDTELRATGNGTPVSNIRLATNRVTRTKDGELKDSTQYHTVICWERLAEQTGKHVTKGRLVYVEGRLESRSFTDKEGKELWERNFYTRFKGRGNVWTVSPDMKGKSPAAKSGDG